MNSEGSFECQCGDGFALDDAGTDCNDIDECDASIDPPTCDHTCNNTEGKNLSPQGWIKSRLSSFGGFLSHTSDKIFKVLLNANVMSVSLLPLIAQIHALTSMNALRITTFVVIMPTAVIMMAVSHASVTMASKLVHLILSPVLTLMNALPVLAPILVKIR